MSGKYNIPAVRVTLVCPYCSQHFSADVPVMEFSRPDREGGAVITPPEVGKRTREIIEDHINECGCRNLTDVQCVLTALISMAAQAVVATNGKPAAIAVLKASAYPYGTA